MDAVAVLVVEDDEATRTSLTELLGAAGYQVRGAASAAQAGEMLAQGAFDAVLLDVLLPDDNGLEVLRRYREGGGGAPVLVLSGGSGVEAAVKALKFGACDFLPKPINPGDLQGALSRALSRPTPSLESDRALVSGSEAMRRVLTLVDRIADTDVPVLLMGESGTGKEVIARAIHAKSRRKANPFIKVNCAALPAELLENELFGHEKGAFTGATGEKPGKFELADRGTIFLDEIGEMTIRLQAKLLQVLQDEEYFRVGGKKNVRVDARVVVATNRELEKEIVDGNFREDLYYRLNVVALRVPPLRERKEDIPALVDHFMRKYGRRYRNGLSELPADVLDAFKAHDWPGNVRELENAVRRLVVLKDPVHVLQELRLAHRAGHAEATVIAEAPKLSEGLNQLTAHARLSNPFTSPQPPPPPPPVPEKDMSLKDIGRRAAMLAEREAILTMLQRTAWNKRKAATRLRISYKALLYKIRESGIIDPRQALAE